MDWLVVGGKVAGDAHIKNGIACQDAFHIKRAPGGFLVVAVADGVGSAADAGEGASYAAEYVAEAAVDLLAPRRENRRRANTSNTKALSIPSLLGLFLRTSRAIPVPKGGRKSDYSTTLALAIVGPKFAAFALVGDCVAAVRFQGEAQDTIAIWPERGRFAGETFTMASDRLKSHIWARIENRDVEQFAVFTDGISKFVLDGIRREVRPGFLEHYFNEIKQLASHGSARGSAQEWEHRLGKRLEETLQHPSIGERCDDDRTLVIAIPRPPRPRVPGTDASLRVAAKKRPEGYGKSKAGNIPRKSGKYPSQRKPFGDGTGRQTPPGNGGSRVFRRR